MSRLATRNHTSLLAIGLMVISTVALPAIVRAQDEAASDTTHKVKVINAFLDHVKSSEAVDGDARAEVMATVTEMRDDEYSRDFAITEGLALMYPEFGQALEAMGTDDLPTANQLLTDLSEKADPYMAADALFFLSRAAMFEEKFEEALPLLERMTVEFGDYSVQVGNALYFKGMAESSILKRQEAIATLKQFLDEHPSAPERMKISAWRRLQELQVIEEGSMLDVFDRMDLSRRHLKLEKSGDSTQENQEEIIKMLNQMIKKAEESECKNCNSNSNRPGDKPSNGQGQGEGQGASNNGAGSQNPDGVVRRTFSNGPASPWSDLRERSRDPAFTAIKDKYPARYQKIIEQYYQSFQNDGSR